MPTRRYPLERGKPKRVKISWSPSSSPYLTIRLDREMVGTILTKRDAEKGQVFSLMDGSELHVQFVNDNVQVLKDGQPLPGSPSDPFHRLKITCRLIFFLGVFNIIWGLFTLLDMSEIVLLPKVWWGFFMLLGMSEIVLLLIGLGFVVTVFFVRRCSHRGLVFAITLFIVDILILTISGFHIGLDICGLQFPGILLTVILYIAIFSQLFQGFDAIKEIDSLRDRVVTVEQKKCS